MNFIRFNAEDIKNEYGYAPVRAYFCISCGCYHLTSKEQRSYKCKSRTQKVLAAYRSMTKKMAAKKRAVKYYYAEEMGLTYVQDEALQQIADTNLKNLEYVEEYKRLRQEADRIAKQIKKMQRPQRERIWLEDINRILCQYETYLSEWTNVEVLKNKCERQIKAIHSRALLDENKIIADTYIARANEIVRKREVAFNSIAKITLNLQDTYSYLVDDMFASANATLIKAESSYAKLKDLKIRGLDEAIETWNSYILCYRNVLNNKKVDW